MKNSEIEDLINLINLNYDNNDIKKAYEFWVKLNDKELEELDNASYEEETFEIYRKYEKYKKMISDEKIYVICDYGRTKIYKEMGYI